MIRTPFLTTLSTVASFLLVSAAVSQENSVGLIERLMALEERMDDAEERDSSIRKALSMSYLVSSVPCQELPGGVWESAEEFAGRFLLGQGNDYTAGSKGGTSQIQLKTEHLPTHSHAQRIGQHAVDGSKITAWNLRGTGGATTRSHTSAAGDGEALEYMPPYRVVFFCQLAPVKAN